MSDSQTKETIQVDTLVVLNRLFDGLRDEVRRGQTETREALTKIDANISDLKKSDQTIADEVHRQGSTLSALSDRVDRLERETQRAHQRVTDSDESRRLEVEAWKAHSKHIESSIGQLHSNDAQHDKALAEQTAMLADIKAAGLTLVRLVKSPRLVAYVTIGALAGGAIAGLLTKMVH